MQRLAFEMNLAETAFVVPAPSGFGLRWFTPIVEIDLCGHATLAAAHTLWTDGIVPTGDAIAFHTRRASARGGSVRVTVNGARVTLGGRAVTVYSGTLRV